MGGRALDSTNECGVAREGSGVGVGSEAGLLQLDRLLLLRLALARLPPLAQREGRTLRGPHLPSRNGKKRQGDVLAFRSLSNILAVVIGNRS